MQGVPREIREIWDLQKNPELTILESLKSRGFLENPGGKQPLFGTRRLEDTAFAYKYLQGT